MVNGHWFKSMSRETMKSPHAAAALISQLNGNIKTMTPNLYLGDLFDISQIWRHTGLNCYTGTRGGGGVAGA